MLKKVLLSISLGALGVSCLLPCYAAAPEKIAKVAPIADLVAEVDAKIKVLEEALASDNSYLESKASTVPNEAGVLAVLAQAVVESDEKATWKAAAADLRDAAKAIGDAKTYDAAKAGLAAAKAAVGGKAGSAKPDAEWNKLCGLGKVMKEINKRKLKLGRTTRKKTLTPAEFEEGARDASVAAVLALAAHDDTHEVKSGKKEDIDEWKKLSKDFQVQMTAAATAFKQQNLAAATDAYKKGNTTCTACHEKFRPGASD